MILFIDNFDSFTYNIVHAVESLGFPVTVVREGEMDFQTCLKMRPKALILGPGPGRPESATLALKCLENAPHSLPILGICLGHQAIGLYFGGKVVRANNIMHGKTSVLAHDGEGLFKGVAQGLQVARYHSLIVDEHSLPKELIVSARTLQGEIMALRHVSRPLFSVQFHPESIATEAGEQMFRNFLSTVAI